jgi:hypothetical protein
MSDQLSHEAEKERIVAAFSPNRNRLTPFEEKLVRALLDNPGGTPTVLSEAVWGKGTHPAN